MTDKNPVGRPKKPFNQKQFEELCQIQCTEKEIAAVLDMSIELLNQNCNRVYECNFLDIYAQKRESGKQSLRRAQWNTALEAKNAVMQIFLGKNMLGQADKQEITGANGGPIEHTDLSALNPEELLTIKNLLEKAGNKEE